MKASNNWPKISVITPSFNQAQFIERTIQSVLSQNYPCLEYIVIDGASTDNTLNLLRQYQTQLTWISEPDRGQTEAINKGFKLATGDIVCWLNADDEFMPGTLQWVAAYFSQHPEAMLVYGQAEAIDEVGRFYGYRGNVKPTNYKELVTLGDFIVQPAAFWRARLLAEVGSLDESLTYCMDYEYWLRASRKYPLHHIPIPLARERFHSNAKTTQATLERIQEIESVARQYGSSGIPRRFRAERTAIYFSETLRQLRLRRWSVAKHFWKLTVSQFSPSLRILFHLLALSLGAKSVTKMRLYYDRWRKLMILRVLSFQ
jgi:glycosyltransferase involved in cell wall biosynthesis